MKALILVFVLFIGSISSAQEPIAALETSEMNILYRGYPNRVIPAVTNNDGRIVSLSATNATVSKEVESDYYIIKPNKGKITSLTISLIGSDGSSEIIRTVEYLVYNLPVPEVYWGGVFNKGKANIRSPLFFVKYPPEIPLNASFKIKSWQVTFEGDTIYGFGSNISTAEEFLKKIPDNTTLIFHFKILGPDGILRMKKGEWTVNAWGEEIGDGKPEVFICE